MSATGTTSRATHPSTHRGDETLVSVVAQDLAAVAVPWELATGSAPDERCHELLLANDVYDAWLIYWPPGSGLEAHDHGGSCGAFAVVSGVLDEYATVDDLDVTTRVPAGRSVSFGASHVHAVANRGDVAVTSVHVYSPPLRTMAYYRPDDDGNLLLQRVDGVEPEAP